MFIIYECRMFLKKIISDKDRLVLSLHQELDKKHTNIHKLNEEVIQLKKEKQEQEETFQNIIKDFQFLSEYNSSTNTVNTQQSHNNMH